MKLRNKKTGQLGNFIINKDHFECVDLDYVPEYRNLTELNEEWEDYEEPKESKESKEYWFINPCGETVSYYEEDEEPEDTEACKEIGNYFATKEEALYIKELAENLANKSPHIDRFEAEQEIRSFVLRYDGIRYAYQLMEKYRKKAIEAMASFPDNKYKESLIALLDYAIQRMH